MKPVCYGDLVLFFYDPNHPKELVLLFRNRKVEAVREIFRPQKIVLGDMVNVKHGYQKKVGCVEYDIGWELNALKFQWHIEIGGNSYEYKVYAAHFLRDGLSAIPHKFHDYHLLVSCRDVYELHTDFGELKWGYIKEQEIEEVLQQKVNKYESGTQYA